MRSRKPAKLEVAFVTAVKAHLTQQKIDAKDLAKMAGMSPPQLSDYLNLKRAPGLPVIERIAGALKLPVAQLLGENAHPQLTKAPTTDPASERGKLLSLIRALSDDDVPGLLLLVQQMLMAAHNVRKVGGYDQE